MFIILEGIDGSGKTTLAQQVANQRPNTIYVSRKSISKENDFKATQQHKLFDLMWPDENGALEKTLPINYWIYLQCTWYTLLSELIISPLLQKGYDVITDGWYYKFWAKLEQEGYTLNELREIFHPITKPDKVILLDVSPNEVLKRKQTFKEYEMGSYVYGDHVTLDTFAQFQTTVHKNLLSYATQYSWECLQMPNSNIFANTQSILKVLSRIS